VEAVGDLTCAECGRKPGPDRERRGRVARLLGRGGRVGRVLPGVRRARVRRRQPRGALRAGV